MIRWRVVVNYGNGPSRTTSLMFPNREDAVVYSALQLRNEYVSGVKILSAETPKEDVDKWREFDVKWALVKSGHEDEVKVAIFGDETCQK